MNERPWRYEVKMTCNAVHLDRVRSWIQFHPAAFFTTYPPRQVNSLYFDGLEGESFEDNLIGVSQRNKLRLRWYGDSLRYVHGFLELKSKSGHLGRKAFFPLEAKFDLNRMSLSEVVQRLREEVDGPFAFWLDQFPQPYLITSYRRQYYETMDRQVRLTIDTGSVAYDQLLQTMPNITLPTPSQEIVMEVKADMVFAQRIADVLAMLPRLWVSKNSKYVNGVLHSLSGL